MANITVHARVAYPHLAQPKAFKGEKDPKYSVTLVIPKDDPQIATIRAIEQALIAKELDGVIPTGNNILLKEAPNNPAMAGCYLMAAKTKDQPGLSHRTEAGRQKLLDPTVIQDGDWCYCAINIYAYTQPSKGVTSFLNYVMFDRRGEGKLGTGGGPSEDEAFAHVPGAAASPGGVTQVNPNPFG